MTDQNTALVMVVDDQEANVSAVGGLLARDGFDVAPCLSGKEALASIAADLPDLVLLDMRMPGMDGFEVLKALQADEATKEIPVIFLTADHERESLVRALSDIENPILVVHSSASDAARATSPVKLVE